MAYFSNGTEGMEYESQYCENCMNYKVRGNDHPVKSCPIWDLHYEYNYDQNRRTKTGKVIASILTTLIPDDTDEISPIAGQCSMFTPRGSFGDDRDALYAEHLRQGKPPIEFEVVN